jgi:hypothetical protein
MSHELEIVNALRDNVSAANQIFAQIAPLKDVFDMDIAKLAHLDRNEVYFGVNEDGTATVLDFQGQGGAPRFTRALALPPAPEVAEVAEAEVVEAEVIPLITGESHVALPRTDAE